MGKCRPGYFYPDNTGINWGNEIDKQHEAKLPDDDGDDDKIFLFLLT